METDTIDLGWWVDANPIEIRFSSDSWPPYHYNHGDYVVRVLENGLEFGVVTRNGFGVQQDSSLLIAGKKPAEGARYRKAYSIKGVEVKDARKL